ncbi:MAG TPA: cation diffusion facilitator family transporter [Anaeromyxobacteraceae bacterium]
MTPDQEKRAVALSSLGAAVLLTGTKLAVGLSTGSLGILSEAAHSGLDLLAAAMTFWAVRLSSRPADPDHPYGHGKFENLSALAQTLLLLATSGWIVYESVRRLFFEEAHVEVTAWSFAVMAMSIVVDVSRSRALRRTAERHRSQALEADALHFSTDVWSSAVVILGLGGILVGRRLGLPWLGQADAVAALAVAGIVVWVTVRLGRKSVDDLLDAVPPELRDRVTRAAEVPGVLDVRRVRLRRSGPETFADVTVTVGREASFERSHEIAMAAREAIRGVLPGADVVIHAQPVAGGEEGTLVAVRLAAARLGLGAHAIRLSGQGAARALECHLEVPESLTLAEAHRRTVEFEEAVRRDLPEVARVVASMEPVGEATAARWVTSEDEAPVRRLLEDLLEESGLDPRPAEVRVQRAGGELQVSFRARLDGTLSVSEARRRAERVERALKARLPGLGRVLVRLEPRGGGEVGSRGAAALDSRP